MDKLCSPSGFKSNWQLVIKPHSVSGWVLHVLLPERHSSTSTPVWPCHPLLKATIEAELGASPGSEPRADPRGWSQELLQKLGFLLLFFFLFFQLDRPRLLPVWVFLTTLWRLWWLCFCLSGHYPASTEARNSWTTAFVCTPRQSLEQRTSTDHGYPEFIFRPGHCKSTLQFASPECWECPPSTIQINTMRMHSRGQSCLHLTPDIQACTSAAFMFPPPQLEIRFLDVQMSGFLQIAGFPLSCLFASDPVVSKRVRVAAEVVCLSGSQRTEA